MIRVSRFIAPTFLVLLLLSSVSAGTIKALALSDQEKALARTIGFPNEVLLTAKRTGGTIERLTGIDAEGNEAPISGISLTTTAEKAMPTIKRLRPQLNPMGYEVYYLERNYGHKPDRLAIIKTRDKYDILRVRWTNGVNYDIDNKGVIKKIKEWDARYGLDFIGADFDWFEAEFKTLPKNMKAFAKEVYEFCPDVVDQGSGSVEALAKEMEKTRTLFLWWD
jgi:hypothetical protein